MRCWSSSCRAVQSSHSSCICTGGVRTRAPIRSAAGRFAHRLFVVKKESRVMMISRIAPCLWFNGEAEDAAKFYVSIFPDSRIDSVSRYDGGTRLPVAFPKGTALMVEFTLAGQRFQALNGGPQFKHSEAISLSVSCRDAKDVDHYWSALTAKGGAEGPCGWCKDRFGVSWQVVPEGLGELLSDPDPGRAGRAMERSEERRVGKEWSSGWAPDQEKS